MKEPRSAGVLPLWFRLVVLLGFGLVAGLVFIDMVLSREWFAAVSTVGLLAGLVWWFWITGNAR